MSIIYTVIRNGAVVFMGDRKAAYKRALKGDRGVQSFATKS